jgi:hypothetical protein
MRKPRIFIASAGKNLHIAHALQGGLREYLPTVWDQGVFGLSSFALPSLIQRSQEADFAIMVLGRDEMHVQSDKTTTFAPNSNVLLELGLFVGSLGLDHVFVLVPGLHASDIKLPSDLLGLTVAYYNSEREDRNWDAAIGHIAFTIRNQISKIWKDTPAEYEAGLFAAFDPEFLQQIATTSRVEAYFIHSRRWRETHGDVLQRRIENGSISGAYFCFPDIRNFDFIRQLASRFDDGPSIPAMISDALTWAMTLMKESDQVTVRLFKRVPSYSFYIFDSHVFLAFYPLSIVRKPVPTVRAPIDSEIGSFVLRDISDCISKKEMEEISLLDLEKVCAQFRVAFGIQQSE